MNWDSFCTESVPVRHFLRLVLSEIELENIAGAGRGSAQVSDVGESDIIVNLHKITIKTSEPLHRTQITTPLYLIYFPLILLKPPMLISLKFAWEYQHSFYTECYSKFCCWNLASMELARVLWIFFRCLFVCKFKWLSCKQD